MRAPPRGQRAEPLILRVADLLPSSAVLADVVARVHPAPGRSYLAETAAGTLVTLETQVRAHHPFRRLSAIRNLQQSMSKIRRELESPPVPTTSDRPE